MASCAPRSRFGGWQDDAEWAWCDNDVDNGGIGGSVIDDSYTTSEDQGRYEQQATGRHWVVDVAGHWE